MFIKDLNNYLEKDTNYSHSNLSVEDQANPATMKALTYDGVGKIKVVDKDIPKLQDEAQALDRCGLTDSREYAPPSAVPTCTSSKATCPLLSKAVRWDTKALGWSRKLARR